jgi:hypothetical protein
MIFAPARGAVTGLINRGFAFGTSLHGIKISWK